MVANRADVDRLARKEFATIWGKKTRNLSQERSDELQLKVILLEQLCIDLHNDEKLEN